jgi:hypothetical protein
MKSDVSGQYVCPILNGRLSNGESNPRNDFIVKIILKYGILMCCCFHASRPFVTNKTTFPFFKFYQILPHYNYKFGTPMENADTGVHVKILLFYFMKKITLSETLIEGKISVLLI